MEGEQNVVELFPVFSAVGPTTVAAVSTLGALGEFVVHYIGLTSKREPLVLVVVVMVATNERASKREREIEQFTWTR